MGKKLNLGHISLIKTYLLANFACFSKTQSLTSAQKTRIKTNLGITDPPSAYIKNAAVNSGVLTLTKQNDTTVTYSYDDSSIKSRLTTAESNISNHTSRLTAIESAYVKSASVSMVLLH